MLCLGCLQSHDRGCTDSSFVLEICWGLRTVQTGCNRYTHSLMLWNCLSGILMTGTLMEKWYCMGRCSSFQTCFAPGFCGCRSRCRRRGRARGKRQRILNQRICTGQLCVSSTQHSPSPQRRVQNRGYRCTEGATRYVL